uniref:Uncharacterized protein n=1 Tax=Anguilla anguilla TaxID=7936 RepID=A0A0E9QJL8_ANGAN
MKGNYINVILYYYYCCCYVLHNKPLPK